MDSERVHPFFYGFSVDPAENPSVFSAGNGTAAEKSAEGRGKVGDGRGKVEFGLRKRLFSPRKNGFPVIDPDSRKVFDTKDIMTTFATEISSITQLKTMRKWKQQ
jgi:hypothetical protein